MASGQFLKVPYLAKLDNIIQPGQTLVVKGVPIGEKFDINLAVGPRLLNYQGDDIGLHVSWRRSEGAIVLNTLERGTWQREERHGGSAVQEAQPFDIRIRAHVDRFEIFVGRKKLADMYHRLPLNILTHVFVAGDVQLKALAWEGNYYSMPYRSIFPGNFHAGKKVIVTGVTDKWAKNFAINLHSGNNVAFHYNIRLNEKVVVRNTLTYGDWGVEERYGGVPFSQNTLFDVVIHNEGHAFQIYVDGVHHCTYRHRVPAEHIDGLGVVGDMQLHSVAFD